MMYCTQSVSFYLCSNNRRERFVIPCTRHVLHSESRPSSVSLRSKRGLYCFSVSEEYSSLNMVWMKNKAAFLARPTHLGLSMMMVMMSSMNKSIDASFALISTASWYDWISGSEGGRYSSMGSKCL